MLPFNFGAVSTRFSGLPAIFQSRMSFNLSDFGSGAGSFAAAAATLP